MDVFISYSRKDISFARILYESIVSRNKEVWIDWEDIPPSTDWLQEIFSAIESADTFIFIISKNSITSDICVLEISHAIKNSKKIIPIVIPGPNPSKIPPSLSKLNWIEFPTTTGEEFQKAFEDLLQTIETDLDWAKSLTKMQNLALDWERSNKDKNKLLSGRNLVFAKTQILDKKHLKKPSPSSILLDFIVTSIENQERRNNRIRWGVFFSVMIIGIGIFTGINQLNLAYSQKTAFQAKEYFDQQNYQMAALFAIRSNQLHENIQASSVLSKLIFENFPLAIGLMGHNEIVNDVAWSKDGQLASVSDDLYLIIWDNTNRKPQQILYAGDYPITNVAWSNDGQLATATNEGQITIWDLETNQPKKEWDCGSGNLNKIAWSPDGLIAADYHGNYIRVWDPNLGTYVHEMNADPFYGSILSSAWSDSNLLVSGTSEGFVILWNPENNSINKIWQTGEGAVNALAWSSIDQLAVGTSNNTILIFDQKLEDPISRLVGHTAEITDLAWSNQNQLASSSSDKSVVLWNLETEKPIYVFRGHSDVVTGIDWSQSGQLASSSNDLTVIVWNANYDAIPHYYSGHEGSITQVEWSPEDQVTSSSEDGSIYIWNSETGEPSVTFNKENGEVRSIAWSTSGQLASLVVSDEQNQIIIWNRDTGEPKTIINSIPKYSYYLAWSPGGQLATTVEESVLIFDIPNSSPARVLEGYKTIVKLAWSSEGDLAGGSFDEVIYIWNKDGKQPIIKIQDYIKKISASQITSLEWLDDGRLVSSIPDGEISIWEMKNSISQRVLKGHSNPVVDLALSDNNLLASVSNGGEIIIWNLQNYNPRIIWEDPENIYTSIDWSNDGRLALGTEQGMVMVSRADLTGRNPCDWVFRNMSISEWKEYSGGFSLYRPVCINLPTEKKTQKLLYEIGNAPLFDSGLILCISAAFLISIVIISGVVNMFIKAKKKARFDQMKSIPPKIH